MSALGTFRLNLTSMWRPSLHPIVATRPPGGILWPASACCLSATCKRFGRTPSGLPIVAAFIAVLCVGCGKEPSSPTNSSGPPQAAPETTAESKQPAEADDAVPDATGRGIVRTDADGRKWIEDVPYDVWFDDPLAIVADDQPVAVSAETVSTAAAAPTTSEAAAIGSPDDPRVAAAVRDWAALIAIEILDDEIKRIHNALNQSLQSAGRYNQSFEEVQVHGAALAALAEIAAQHSEQTAWQGNARYVRDLGARIEEQAQERGRAAFDGVRLPFERLLDLLGADRPTDLEEPDADAEFAERADRGSLMKRMETALQWLRQNKSTEDGFAKDADDTLHEAAILAALSAVVATGGYTSADEPEYQAHIAALIDANLELTGAVQTKNFGNFSQALARVEKKCNDCHQEYRFADEF